MITDAYNLVEVLAAGFIGACVGGVGVFLATLSVRNDAALDRAEASENRGKAEAARVAMESARMLLPLHPAYQAHTAQFEMIRDEPEPPVADLATARDCDGYMWQEQGGEELGMWRVLDDGASVGEAIDLDTLEHEHGPVTIIYPDGSEGSAADLVDRPEPDCCDGHDGEQCIVHDDAGSSCCEQCPSWDNSPQPNPLHVPSTALVLVDEPPVTADDLAPIGPDRMPRLTFWGRVALGAALLPLLVALVLLALAVLARVGWDRAGEWRADRSRRRETEPVEMELAHPAPADVYEPRHLAPAGRWWWSR